MCIEVATQVVMVYLSLQRLKLSAGIIIVTLKLGGLNQFLKLFLADLVIGKASLDNSLFEILIVGIRQMEVDSRYQRRMLGDIVHHIVEHHLRRVQAVQIERDISHRVGLHHQVRRDALLHLDATTTGQVVARGGQLQIGVIGQVHVRNLYQSLAIGLRTDDDATFQVLQGTRGNL